MTRQHRLALWMVIVAAGAMLVGWDQGNKLGASAVEAVTLTRAGTTTTISHTRVVARVVKGRVVKLASGTRVVDVPRVVVYVRSCHRTAQNHCARFVVVPARRWPLKDGRRYARHRIRCRSRSQRRSRPTRSPSPRHSS